MGMFQSDQPESGTGNLEELPAGCPLWDQEAVFSLAGAAALFAFATAFLRFRRAL